MTKNKSLSKKKNCCLCFGNATSKIKLRTPTITFWATGSNCIAVLAKTTHLFDIKD